MNENLINWPEKISELPKEDKNFILGTLRKNIEEQLYARIGVDWDPNDQLCLINVYLMTPKEVENYETSGGIWDYHTVEHLLNTFEKYLV